ncbi:MAG: collagen binding domain-containing protein [Planctomycetota bacterium]
MRARVARLLLGPLGIGLLGIGAVALWLWLSSHTSITASPGRIPSHDNRLASADEDTAAAERTPNSYEALERRLVVPEAASSPLPGLFGFARRATGEPLPGITIRLTSPAGAETTRTDADGAFAFADAHGPLTCVTLHHVRIERKLTLAEGQHASVVLQADGPVVLLTGTLRRGLTAIHDRAVRAQGRDDFGRVDHSEYTDFNGRFVHLLRAGRYELLAAGPPTSLAWELDGTPTWVEVATEATRLATLNLKSRDRHRTCELALPCGCTRIHVRDTAQRPIADATVTLRAMDGSNASFTRRTDSSGDISFDELQPGPWQVTAEHGLHLSTEPTTVHVDPSCRASDITTELDDAGAVHIRLWQGRTTHEALALDTLILRANGATMTGRRVPGTNWQASSLRFDSVPVGQHTLEWQDIQRDDGRIRYAPVEPQTATHVEITPGTTHTVDLQIAPRARLRIDLVGTTTRATTIEVFGQHGQVVASRRGQDYWSAEVPPGDYAVHIRSGTTDRVEHIAVATADAQRTVRL